MADNLDQEMKAVTEAISRVPVAPVRLPGNGYNLAPPPHNPGPYDFEELGRRIADGLVQAAEEQLVQAQNALEQSKAFAADMRARIADKARELHDMNERMKQFGESILGAHRRFHGE